LLPQEAKTSSAVQQRGGQQELIGAAKGASICFDGQAYDFVSFMSRL
jgi:hypothetical protein